MVSGVIRFIGWIVLAVTMPGLAIQIVQLVRRFAEALGVINARSDTDAIIESARQIMSIPTWIAVLCTIVGLTLAISPQLVERRIGRARQSFASHRPASAADLNALRQTVERLASELGKSTRSIAFGALAFETLKYRQYKETIDEIKASIKRPSLSAAKAAYDLEKRPEGEYRDSSESVLRSGRDNLNMTVERVVKLGLEDLLGFSIEERLAQVDADTRSKAINATLEAGEPFHSGQHKMDWVCLMKAFDEVNAILARLERAASGKADAWLRQTERDYPDI